eukprot:TRINITY_DN12139_c0_g3_i2.p1 TRINITY_DN12139_c0_g3~~TRINITY_DN12139_c0_g3_i2.p1  ORF type:complete len:207 (+),score=13.47 TRINITY_DN12139_c0_g3_i2:108-728(+)
MFHSVHAARSRTCLVCSTSTSQRRVQRRAEADSSAGSSQASAPGSVTASESEGAEAKPSKLEADKSVKNIASTFAPRASGNTGKNPAVKGTTLYNVFTVQAWACLVLGGLLSYNVIFPSDQPDLWRLMGMWSAWMFTIPSLRARECTPLEKDWLNYAFLIVPFVNVTLPLVWKSFPFVYTADVVALASIYYWKVTLPQQESSQTDA